MHEDIREEVKHEDPQLEIHKEIRGEKNNYIGEEKQEYFKEEFLNKGFVFPIDVFSTEEAEYINIMSMWTNMVLDRGVIDVSEETNCSESMCWLPGPPSWSDTPNCCLLCRVCWTVRTF